MKHLVTLNEGDIADIICQHLRAKGYKILNGAVKLETQPLYDHMDHHLGKHAVTVVVEVELPEKKT